MGYTTQFSGILNFKKPLTSDEELFLNTILNEDFREHPEWEGFHKSKDYMSYIDFEITKNKDGLEHNGAEKSYNATGVINLILNLMKSKFPDFGLMGKLLAQGESIGDIWYLRIENDVAVYEDLNPKNN